MHTYKFEEGLELLSIVLFKFRNKINGNKLMKFYCRYRVRSIGLDYGIRLWALIVGLTERVILFRAAQNLKYGEKHPLIEKKFRLRYITGFTLNCSVARK